jgi:hypothetical protein
VCGVFAQVIEGMGAAIVPPHPSFAEQRAALQEALAGLTPARLGCHLKVCTLTPALRRQCWCSSFTTQARLGMDLIRVKPFPESNGVINTILLLDVRDKNGEEKRVVLLVANPHTYWARRKTSQEVAIMGYVRRHTTIPVPQVLDYSDNAETSPLGCEYLLLEHMRGVPLSDVIESGAPAEVIARYSILVTCFDMAL